MSQPFIAEIRIFPYNFAPRGWAFCNGQLLPISQNTALFSLVGTTYGGDGRTTFGLPNLQGRAAMHAGTGPGLSPYRLGQRGGTDTVTLTLAEMAKHNHTMDVSTEDGDTNSVANNYLGRGSNLYAATASLVAMATEALPNAGGGQAHNNVMPLLTLNFCIALIGVYPSRS